MRKLLAFLLVVMFLGGCAIDDKDQSERIPKFSTPASRDAVLLKELEKQTKELQEQTKLFKDIIKKVTR